MVERNKLIPGLSYEEYAAVNGVRASHLHKMRVTPAHLKYGEEREDTDALRLGRYIHSALERGEDFLGCLRKVPVFTGRTKDGRDSERSKEALDRRAEWLASLGPGEFAVKPDEYDMIAGILAAVRSHKLLRNMLKGATAEGSLFTEDPETGLRMQCRLDAISAEGFVVDFKSTRMAHWDSFQYDVFSRRLTRPFYILSAAHYAHCARVAGVGRNDSFTFVAIEKKRPYGIQAYPMDEAELSVGEQVRSRLMRQYAECDATGVWPGYEERAVHTTIPRWVDYEHADGEA